MVRSDWAVPVLFVPVVTIHTEHINVAIIRAFSRLASLDKSYE